MLILALVATVASLVWMGFFMLGSLPLLVLKHDTPLDARFIRGLFNVYYTAILVTSTVGAVAYAFNGRPLFAFAAALVAAVGAAGRFGVVRHMDMLRAGMSAEDSAGIRRFRRVHIGGMLVNVALLLLCCLGLTQLRL